MRLPDSKSSSGEFEMSLVLTVPDGPFIRVRVDGQPPIARHPEMRLRGRLGGWRAWEQRHVHNR